MKNALNYLKPFSNFSGLGCNLDKYKIADIGVLKNVNVALCGMKNINLTKESTKILGAHISYNKKSQNDLKFCKIIKNSCNV